MILSIADGETAFCSYRFDLFLAESRFTGKAFESVLGFLSMGCLDWG